MSTTPGLRAPPRALCLALLLALLALLLASPPALGVLRSGGQPAAATPGSPQTKHKTRPKPASSEPPTQLTEPGQVSASNLAKELGASGQVDPIAGLGIRNPVCDQLAQIRDRATRLSCEANGSPESTYPTSNYGFDVFISTGVTHPIGDFTAAFVTILNGIWLGLIFVLKLVMELLGLAFGLNPFASGPTMSRISASLGRLYIEITDPWLATLVVCGGIWFAHRGLIHRDLAGGIGGTLAAIAMVVVGLWIVHQPRESVGRLAGIANEVALGTISAPESGSINRPVGTYAETMAHTWSRLVEVPFAGLDFSDVHWALSPPPKEALEKADAEFCQDVGALATIAAYERLGDKQAAEECGAFARKLYGKPHRVVDLYLRSSPGSHAREALWNYFDGEERYKAKVAAQGGDGALTRLSMLALFAFGLLGSLLLLAWLAIRLFTQAAIAFVLLLATPFALFFPLLGDAGRRAFKTWGITFFGSVIAKVIYAAFLSIVLLGISIIGRIDGPGGSATGFLLSSAFTWAILLKRNDLIGMLSVGDHHRHLGLGLSGLAALSLARRASRPATSAATRLTRTTAERGRERIALGPAATRETAREELRSSARALGDQRYAAAKRTVAAYEAPRRHTQTTQPPKPVSSHADKTQSRASTAPSRRNPSQANYEQALQLVHRADQNQSHSGERWSEHDLDRFAAEDRRLLEKSTSPADHAHRAGIERSRFEELRGPERERVEAQIEKARIRDRQRLPIAHEPPGRIAGRGRLAIERLRQSGEGEAPARREHLRSLRRERRAGEHLNPRRNLSRGA